MPHKVMTVYGTRPEAIKVAPVVRALQASAVVDSVTVATGQHREMLDQVNKVFGLSPHHDLDVFTHGQGLNALMAKILNRIDAVIAAERPHAVLVQGDTSTATAAAIAAFNRGVPVFHLEAGLRSGDTTSPFPEEANRRLTGQLASLHLAPTRSARTNLLLEAVPAPAIVVTGNTVIDALLHASCQKLTIGDPDLRAVILSGRPLLLVTTHRRENWGGAMEGIGRALRRLATELDGWTIVLPLHRNPLVRDAVLPQLAGLRNVLATEPLPYGDFTRVLASASIVLTDSGGIQEEAPSLGKPVLVMRENTERPEAVDAGAVRLIGTDEDRIVAEVRDLIADEARFAAMSGAVNPYGDGHAAARVRAAIEAYFGVGVRLPDFEAPVPAHSRAGVLTPAP
jgi:UDP-N-acetylglucosamine 2-epimerase (non-hydrolysing)